MKSDILERFSPNLDEVEERILSRLSAFFDPAGRLKEDCAEPAICYNCRSKDTSAEFFVGGFRHVRCGNCGMVYVNPRLNTAIVESTYSEDAYTTLQYRRRILPALEFRKGTLAARKYGQIERYFDRPGRILDVGCGVGEVLSVFKEHGWACTGIEFNDFASAYARDSFGLDVRSQSVFDFGTDERYDCIMLWNVLEHFVEPRRLLEHVRGLLAPGGMLLVEVPSADSLLVRFFEGRGMDNRLSPKRILIPDRHLMLFSHRALREMLASCGFRIEELRTNGLDVSTLFRLLDVRSGNDEAVLTLQRAVDECGSGDLMRAFCRHAEDG